MRQFKGAVFDMDGVIINSEPQHYEADVMLCDKYGKNFPKGYEEIAGIRDFIKSLHENQIKLAIASSSPENEIRAMVETLGIDKYFTKLVSGESVAHPKPAPDVFLKAVAALELTPEDCVVVEDSGTGIKAGVAAGMPVIGFLNPHSGHQDLSQASIVVEGFEEVDYTFAKQVYERAHHLPWRIAKTTHCLIRESVPQDYEAVSSIYNMEGCEFLKPMESYEQFCQYIVYRYPFYGYGMWTVLDREMGMVIGRAGLEEREVDGAVYTELGYMLHSDYRGKGIAEEICRAILAYAKDTLDMEEIYLYVHPENLPSLSLAKKLRFEKENLATENGAVILKTSIAAHNKVSAELREDCKNKNHIR
ncbi:MAG: GNAT family N-acetyltransferase [Lachnospiraceae bacterium]|nr:GNAT family N-acetyltransferase [Lachnospiraceae bacterium]